MHQGDGSDRRVPMRAVPCLDGNEKAPPERGFGKSGGAREDRTPDLVIANDALSQLSYGPTVRQDTCARREF